MANSKIKSVAKSAWWLFMLSGVLSILFGLFAVFWPGLTVSILIFMFGLFVTAIGAACFITSIIEIKINKIWWLLTLFSLFCIAAGIYLFINPSTTLAIFVVLIAIVVFARALIDLINASYSNDTSSKRLWITLGILGIIFGIAILVYPTGTTTAFIWVVGLYTFIRGIADVVYAFQIKIGVRKLKKITKTSKK